MAVETEIKYLGVDLAALRHRLLRLGAVSGGAHFESNVLLDLPDGCLFRQEKLLRVRLQEWPGKSRCLVTFKKPLPQVEPMPRAEISGFSGPKKREELEFTAGDFAACLAVLENLGYVVWARYEKARESFRLHVGAPAPAGEDVEVELDRLNFISVVEMEGEEAALQQAEKLLDLDNFKKSSTNYHTLHQEWRKKNGLPASNDFVFEPCGRERLRMELGLD